MIPLPEGITVEDTVQWLQGGICMIVNEGPPRPFITDRVDDGTLYGRFMEDDFGTARTVETRLARAYWPMMGSINIDKFRCAVHVERQPQKQYKRTFTHRLLDITVPRAWELGKVLGREMANVRTASLPLIKALFHPEYVSFDTALAMLADGWLSVAVNPRVIVAGDSVGKRVIYYRGEAAASISGDVAQPLSDELTILLIRKVTGDRYTWR